MSLLAFLCPKYIVKEPCVCAYILCVFLFLFICALNALSRCVVFRQCTCQDVSSFGRGLCVCVCVCVLCVCGHTHQEGIIVLSRSLEDPQIMTLSTVNVWIMWVISWWLKPAHRTVVIVLQLPINKKFHLHHEFVLRTLQGSYPCSMPSSINTILTPQPLGLFVLTDRFEVMVTGSYVQCVCICACEQMFEYLPPSQT